MFSGPAQWGAGHPSKEPHMIEFKLKAIEKYLNRADVVEIIINKPGEVRLELRNATWEIVHDKAVTREALWQIAKVIANANNILDFERKPKISSMLPGGHRLELFLAYAADHHLALAVRRFTPNRYQLDDFLPRPDDPPSHYVPDDTDSDVYRKLTAAATSDQARADLRGLITEIAASPANIIISGGTSSGKTQCINTLLDQCVPKDRRMIVIQDTPELDVSKFADHKLFTVNRLATEQDITYTDVIDACTRLRPDRIILGELSMDNSYTVLRLLNTGHGGFMTTVHSDSPADAFDAIATNIMLMRQVDSVPVVKALTKKIDFIIQTRRLEDYANRRVVRRIVDIYKRGN